MKQKKTNKLIYTENYKTSKELWAAEMMAFGGISYWCIGAMHISPGVFFLISLSSVGYSRGGLKRKNRKLLGCYVTTYLQIRKKKKRKDANNSKKI